MTMRKETHNDPEFAGRIARGEGRPLLDNPYEKGERERTEWRDGWMSEDRALRNGEV